MSDDPNRQPPKPPPAPQGVEPPGGWISVPGEDGAPTPRRPAPGDATPPLLRHPHGPDCPAPTPAPPGAQPQRPLATPAAGRPAATTRDAPGRARSHPGRRGSTWRTRRRHRPPGRPPARARSLPPRSRRRPPHRGAPRRVRHAPERRRIDAGVAGAVRGAGGRTHRRGPDHVVQRRQRQQVEGPGDHLRSARRAAADEAGRVGEVDRRRSRRARSRSPPRRRRPRTRRPPTRSPRPSPRRSPSSSTPAPPT